MESEKLVERIKEWTVRLGFRSLNVTSSLTNSFTLLTSTPHRRQLFEILIECIQTRKTIEYMRKQLLVHKLKTKKIENSCSFRKGVNRINLWQRQNTLESQINDQKLIATKTENNIQKKECNLILEICKLVEMEKECEELKEKTLVLVILIQKEKLLIEAVDKFLHKLIEHHHFNEIKLNEKIQFHLLELENLNNKIEVPVSDIEKAQNWLWFEIIKQKKEVSIKLNEFLKENLIEGNTLSKKEAEIEKSLVSLVKQFRQTITEKALQAIVNETEERLLNLEIEKLEKKLEKSISKAGILQYEAFSQLKDYAKNEGVEARQQFLKKEISGLEDEINIKNRLFKKSENSRSIYQEDSKKIDGLLVEIRALKKALEVRNKDFSQGRSQLRTLLGNLKKETEDEILKKELSETICDLKTSSNQQVQIFIETPLYVFKSNFSPENSWDRQNFAHFLNYFGKEFKTFLSRLLIPPHREICSALKEVKSRKQSTEEGKDMISKMQNLSDSQTKIFDQLISLKLGTDSCEKDLKRSEEVLRNLEVKAAELKNSVEKSSNILHDWAEQSFRFMIPDSHTLDGKTLKEFEGRYQ